MSVELILDKHNIGYKKSGQSLVIHCLNPEHEDRNPSMLVNKYTGSSKCMSCGKRLDIFKFFGEKANYMSILKDKFRNKLSHVAFESLSLEFPEKFTNWHGSFRGISEKTLRKFEAFQCPDFPGYICFPLRNASGKIMNFIGRDTTGTRTPKYLFFYKRPVKMCPMMDTFKGSVILVEGWFDMLNLYENGITNARALFGTTTFNEETLRYLKVEDVSEIVLMLDSDAAGQTASKKIKEALDSNYIPNRTIKLPEGKDPGDLSAATIIKLKEQLYGKNSNS